MTEPTGPHRSPAVGVLALVALAVSGCGFLAGTDAAQGGAVVGGCEQAAVRREAVIAAGAVPVDRRGHIVVDERLAGPICVEVVDLRAGAREVQEPFQPARESGGAPIDPLVLIGLASAALLLVGVSFLAFREPTD